MPPLERVVELRGRTLAFMLIPPDVKVVVPALTSMPDNSEAVEVEFFTVILIFASLQAAKAKMRKMVTTDVLLFPISYLSAEEVLY
jgi:hypothetical protein